MKPTSTVCNKIFRSVLISCKKSFQNMSTESTRQNSAARENDAKLSNRLIWIDCEMTGLDAEKCRLIEIACIVTEGDTLDIVAEGPSLIIHQPPCVVNEMDDWCKKTFAKSGLTKSVELSKISEKDAEFSLLEFVRKHTAPGLCPLAGNTVHMDKTFLTKYMPTFTEHLHYRIVDVSTVKELCRALDDIKESIEELKYYRRTIFKESV